MAYKVRISRRSASWMHPLPNVRTPEEHRAILERKATTIIDLNSKAVKAALKRERREKRRALMAEKRAAKPPTTKKLTPKAVEYYAYIASDQWKITKAKWMQSGQCRGHFCHAAGCGQTTSLQMHHRTYKRLGREDMNDLVLVCGGCHLKIHELAKSGVKLREATRRVVGY